MDVNLQSGVKYTQALLYIYIHICIYINVYIYMYVYVYIYMYIYIYVYVYRIYIYIYIHTRSHPRARALLKNGKHMIRWHLHLLTKQWLVQRAAAPPRLCHSIHRWLSVEHSMQRLFESRRQFLLRFVFRQVESVERRKGSRQWFVGVFRG